MILLENEEQAFLQMVMGAEGIIEVDKLPTVNINTKSFYKTPAGLYWYGNGGFNKVLNRKDENDIVTAAVGSSSNPGNYTPSVPGLVKLYNQSSGLRLDDNKQLCIAQARRGAEGEDGNDLLATESNKSANRPITPANLQYALSQFVPLVTYTGAFNSQLDKDDARATSVKSVKALKEALQTDSQTKANNALASANSEAANKVASALTEAKSYTDQKFANSASKTVVKKKILVRGEGFPIPPNVFGIVFPCDTIQFKTFDTSTDILEGGVSFIWTTNRYVRTEGSTQIDTYDLAIISLANGSIFDLANLVQSSHDTYDIPGNRYCRMINPSGSVSGTGYAYFYYVEFN